MVERLPGLSFMLKNIRKPKSLYWKFQSLLAFQFDDHTLSQFFAWIEEGIMASPITNSFFFLPKFWNYNVYGAHFLSSFFTMCTALFQNSCTRLKHIVLEHWKFWYNAYVLPTYRKKQICNFLKAFITHHITAKHFFNSWI